MAAGYRAAIAAADAKLEKAEKAQARTAAALRASNDGAEEARRTHQQQTAEAVESLRNLPEPFDETKVAAGLKQAGEAHQIAVRLLRTAHDERRKVLADFVGDIRAEAASEWRASIAAVAARIGDLSDDCHRINELQSLLSQSIRAHNLSVGDRPHWDPKKRERIEERPQRVSPADLAAAAAQKAASRGAKK